MLEKFLPGKSPGTSSQSGDVRFSRIAVAHKVAACALIWFGPGIAQRFDLAPDDSLILARSAICRLPADFGAPMMHAFTRSQGGVGRVRDSWRWLVTPALPRRAACRQKPFFRA
jgi:hypothetical protein